MAKMIPSITKLEKDCQSVDLHEEDFEGDKKGLSELNPVMKVEIKLLSRRTTILAWQWRPAA